MADQVEIYQPYGRHAATDQGDALVGEITKRAGDKGHALDSEDAEKRLAKLKEWWYEARTTQAENRYQQAIDEDFYDGLQWAEQDINALQQRGQSPLVYNKIKVFLDWIIGTERRTKIEARILPREDDDVLAADTKNKLYKYLNDVNKGAFVRSRAFAEAVKGGVGWLEDGARSDPGDEVLYSRTESWRNVWFDPLAKEPDLSDARFIMRARWVDLDVAIAMFPDREGVLRQAAVSHALYPTDEDEDLYYPDHYQRADDQHAIPQISYFNETFHVGDRRQRVRLIEAQYRVPENVKLLDTRPTRETPPELVKPLTDLHGTELDPKDEVHKRLQRSGHASVYDALKMRMRFATWCDKGLLQDMPSPYRHDQFSLTPVWAYRRARDNMPYGAVRNMRDPQEDLNKRRSKALFILSTRGIIADEETFEDWDAVSEELARPDFVLKKKKGHEYEIFNDTTLAEEHITLMQHDEMFMQSAGGVTEENIGQESNAESGRAIRARQEQGTVVTAPLFDNLRYAIQVQGEKQLSLMEQFYDRPKVIRLTDDRGRPTFTRVNYPQVGEGGGVEIENDITRTQADFVVDTQDYSASVRQAQFEMLAQLMEKQPPEVAIELLDLVFEQSDLSGKDEIVRRIRDLNGQVDPDDPQAEEQRKARNSAKQRQQQLTERQQLAEIRKAESEASSSESEALGGRAEFVQTVAATVAEILKNPEHAEAVDRMTGRIKRETQQDATAASEGSAPQPPMQPPQQ